MIARTHHRRAFPKPLALLGVLAALLVVPGEAEPAFAASITVSTKDDELNADGDCSLREAIQAANTDASVDACTSGSGVDIITLPAVTFFLSIPGQGEDANATGDLDIAGDLTINGAGAGTTIIDGDALDRVFHIDPNNSGVTVEISGVTVRNGSGSDSFPFNRGGGILNAGTLTLTSSTVSDNTATGLAGGIMNSNTLTLSSSTVSGNTASAGGGIGNVGTVTITNSTISGNTTTSGFGGGILNFGTVTITNSTISGNTTPSANGGGISNKGTMTVGDSTISGNATGFSSDGGGIRNEAALTITNSTINGNTAGTGGGGGISNVSTLATLTITNSTISGNTTNFGTGGGIRNFGTLTVSSSTVSGNVSTFGTNGGIANAGTSTLNNTIVANSSPNDCVGGITSSGHNLDSDGTCGLTGTGDISGGNANLDSLALNAPGNTETHALLPGSDAIDAVPLSDCTVTTDQRGVARPQGAACDIGAFELVADSDGDGVLDDDDACPETPGDPDRQGCPVGDANTVTLHTIDQQKSGACPGGKGSCKSPIEGAEVRVFDRNDAAFQGAYGHKNPSGSIYDQVFENDIGRVGACTTVASGQCTAGEETTGDYLVIVKTTVDTSTVYTGKPKSPEDFDATGLASKDFQVIKVLKKKGGVQFSGGSKTVVSGSYLEVVYPDFAIWEDVASGYVYPFIFTSDSDWNVDICAYVPTGYAIVGVYDENGDLLTDSSCTQTFVSGETKVVAYEVVDIGSPEPVLGAVLSLRHEGEVTQVDVEVPGERTYVEKPAAQPAQLPATGAGDSGGDTPVWPSVAALAGVSAMLLGGIAVWRRRRV